MFTFCQHALIYNLRRRHLSVLSEVRNVCTKHSHTAGQTFRDSTHVSILSFCVLPSPYGLQRSLSSHERACPRRPGTVAGIDRGPLSEKRSPCAALGSFERAKEKNHITPAAVIRLFPPTVRVCVWRKV